MPKTRRRTDRDQFWRDTIAAWKDSGRLSGLCSLFCLGLAGCVEGETTYTVNPDGTTKVRMEIVTAVPPNFGGPPQKKDAAEDTPEGMLRLSVRSMLENPKLAAWKDVSAEILPNGKLKFCGTAYVRQFSVAKPGQPLFDDEKPGCSAADAEQPGSLETTASGLALAEALTGHNVGHRRNPKNSRTGSQASNSLSGPV